MKPFPQSIQITVEFRVEHTPNTPAHLEQVAKRYLESKGVTLLDGKIVI